MGEKGILLKDRVDLPLMGRYVVYPHTVKKYVPGGRRQEAADHPKGSCLTAAGRSEECEKFFIVEVEI